MPVKQNRFVYPTVGKRFGKLRFREPARPVYHGKKLMRTGVFDCDCGNEVTCAIRSLRRGLTRSCGCLQREHIRRLGKSRWDHKRLEGLRFGRSVVLDLFGITKNGRRVWRCRCDCGRIHLAVGSDLRNGHTSSCGCLKTDTLRQRATHRYSGKKLYRRWGSMIQRCTNPNIGPHWKDYGGRGIRVCKRWRESFIEFRKDMGEPPFPFASLDRRDNAGHYSCGKCEECLSKEWPMNVRWATLSEQARNQRSRTRRGDWVYHRIDSVMVLRTFARAAAEELMEWLEHCDG